MKRPYIIACRWAPGPRRPSALLCAPRRPMAQGNYEIQVYGADTVEAEDNDV